MKNVMPADGARLTWRQGAAAQSGTTTAMEWTHGLRDEYAALFRTCVIRSERTELVDAAIGRIFDARRRYEMVAGRTDVPWQVIAVIHMLEAGGRFTGHLHNGDPLTARTVRVPAGRPRVGAPPFAWEASAVDALVLEHMHMQRDWSLPRTLYSLEAYNGWGYRRHHPEVLSPYLWGMSTHYAAGKYVADGRWSPTAVSAQCGAAVLLRRLAELGALDLDGGEPAAGDDAPLVRFSATLPFDPAEVERAAALQRWLNTLPGIFLRIDGVAGPRTSDAFRRVTGSYLPGDPRTAAASTLVDRAPRRVRSRGVKPAASRAGRRAVDGKS